jgi:hypothetical protein
MSIRDFKPGDTALVQPHGVITRSFKGRVIRVDVDNYLVFVRKPNRRTVWGCCAAFVS